MLLAPEGVDTLKVRVAGGRRWWWDMRGWCWRTRAALAARSAVEAVAKMEEEEEEEGVRDGPAKEVGEGGREEGEKRERR